MQWKLKHAYVAALLGIGAITTAHSTTPVTLQAQNVQSAQAPDGRLGPVTDLQSALRQTSAVVEGLVTDIRYEYSDENGPWTRVILSNVRAHLGSAQPTVEIRQFGGPLPNGHIMVAAELPVFVLGKQYVVFLRNTSWNVSPVVGDLAMRVEAVNNTEVLVDSDGMAITGVGPKGVEVGPALFEGPRMDGKAPQALATGLRVLDRAPLDRRRFVEGLASTMVALNLQVTGSFDARPAGEFKWRAQVMVPPAGTTIPTEAIDRTGISGRPEVDTSERTR